MGYRGQFYQHFMRRFSLVTIWVWRKDFGKKPLSYKNLARKMLMKLTAGENPIKK